MAERKLVPPAEQRHEGTILIPKRHDDLLQRPYVGPRQLVESVGGLVRPATGQRPVAASHSLTKKGVRWSADLVLAFHTELQTS
jgi:hypothetical protein